MARRADLNRIKADIYICDHRGEEKNGIPRPVK
jgi:hypothetical protein